MVPFLISFAFKVTPNSGRMKEDGALLNEISSNI